MDLNVVRPFIDVAELTCWVFFYDLDSVVSNDSDFLFLKLTLCLHRIEFFLILWF